MPQPKRSARDRESKQAEVRVLIVEDDGVFRRGLARLFPEGQFEVTQATDGEQAVRAIARRLPDLVICDYRLPGLNGLEVLRQLRQIGPLVPFILVTGHLSDEVETRARQLGIHSIIEKPLVLQVLRRRCREALGVVCGSLD